jgi:hypothetical protein
VEGPIRGSCGSEQGQPVGFNIYGNKLTGCINASVFLTRSENVSS